MRCEPRAAATAWFCATLCALALAASPAEAQQEPAASLNGFSLAGLNVAREELEAAGPPRDGIRSVDAPQFATPEEAALWVREYNPVIGVALGGEARAYPVHLIEHHQIVNDVIAGVPVVVTFDPLTSAPAAYRRKVGDEVLEFGFTGLLFRAGAVLYDRGSDSLWSQWDGRAIAGRFAGKGLERIQTRQELLGVWLERHPETRVLRRPELEKIDYRLSPYSAYWVSERHPPLRAELEDDRFHPKEVVLGVEAGGRTRAYLGSLMTAAGGRVVDELGDVTLRVAYDGESATFIWELEGEGRVTDAYWFAWRANHPKTEVWRPGGDSSPKP